MNMTGDSDVDIIITTTDAVSTEGMRDPGTDTFTLTTSVDTQPKPVKYVV